MLRSVCDNNFEKIMSEEVKEDIILKILSDYPSCGELSDELQTVYTDYFALRPCNNDSDSESESEVELAEGIQIIENIPVLANVSTIIIIKYNFVKQLIYSCLLVEISMFLFQVPDDAVLDDQVIVEVEEELQAQIVDEEDGGRMLLEVVSLLFKHYNVTATV